MLRLILFDIARALRPRLRGLTHGHLAGLNRLPGCLHADLGFGGDMLFTRALHSAERQRAERNRRDAARLLSILSEITRRRGFGPLEWERDDA